MRSRDSWCEAVVVANKTCLPTEVCVRCSRPVPTRRPRPTALSALCLGSRLRLLLFSHHHSSTRHNSTTLSQLLTSTEPAMERKRKLPARAARVEGVSKKRTSTPPEQPVQIPTPTAPAPPPRPVEDPLPRTLLPGKPLPTVETPQPENLPVSQYQTVTER